MEDQLLTCASLSQCGTGPILHVKSSVLSINKIPCQGKKIPEGVRSKTIVTHLVELIIVLLANEFEEFPRRCSVIKMEKTHASRTSCVK